MGSSTLDRGDNDDSTSIQGWQRIDGCLQLWHAKPLHVQNARTWDNYRNRRDDEYTALNEAWHSADKPQARNVWPLGGEECTHLYISSVPACPSPPALPADVVIHFHWQRNTYSLRIAWESLSNPLQPIGVPAGLVGWGE